MALRCPRDIKGKRVFSLGCAGLPNGGRLSKILLLIIFDVSFLKKTAERKIGRKKMIKYFRRFNFFFLTNYSAERTKKEG